MSHFKLVIHGGAGTPSPDAMNASERRRIHTGLTHALKAGHHVLAHDGSAVDAVVAAVMALEDDEEFNAGRGAVFDAAGHQAMDAALMDGHTGSAGAVAGICGPRNPIIAARAVMEQSAAVLLAGAGAETFLRGRVPFADPDYFRTERRWRALAIRLAAQEAGGQSVVSDQDRHGTVGAVALDARGRLAAATSTGGMTAKLPGRVGDCPLIGCGTWACAVSATGDGEHFIRAAAGHEVCAQIRLARIPVEAAAVNVLSAIGRSGGSGGLIAIDAAGKIAMPFNSHGMYRGLIAEDGAPATAIFGEALQRDPAVARNA